MAFFYTPKIRFEPIIIKAYEIIHEKTGYLCHIPFNLRIWKLLNVFVYKMSIELYQLLVIYNQVIESNFMFQHILLGVSVHIRGMYLLPAS